MRIGFDMLAVQSPHHGHRGIGRYSAHLVSTLLNRNDGHEYVLYVHDGLPRQRVPESSHAETRVIRPAAALGQTVSSCVATLAATNPDGLDALVVLSPFEMWSLYTPPPRPAHGMKLASVVYDLIPFLFQDESRPDPQLIRHYRVLESLRRYDALLAISESTRRDLLAALKLAPEKVVTIGGASNPAYFTPPADRSNRPADDAAALVRLGVDRPYVLNVGGLDHRKNTWSLIDGFAALPEPLRNSHQLVLTFAIDDWGRQVVRDYVAQRGLGDSVVVTGEVSDDDLRTLYRWCELFAFPSGYEGFGLPILEALHCGAPVVAGNNSSQVEVVGDGGLLCEPGDPESIASQIGRILTDDALRARCRERGVAHASTFHWSAVADRLLESVGRPPARTPARGGRPRGRKPAVAYFSPFPPRKSGISDYSAYLLEELRSAYRLDLVHDAGYVPDLALASTEFACWDYRAFDRLASARNYHAVVYQMGNSRYHNFMYEAMQRHPGVVTLHDFSLAGYHIHAGHARGDGFGFLRDELLEWYPEDRDDILEAADGWGPGTCWSGVARQCAERGWHVNRRVLDAAEAVIVHSPWCRAQVEASSPWYADKVVVIPHGIDSRRWSDAERAAVRDRFDIPRDAIVVASFGFVHPEKMSPEALDAFATLTADHPNLLFLFAGEEADGGEVRRHAASLGLTPFVRFLGRQPMDAFVELMAATDVGVNLRRPPTNGETSGALLHLLSCGVATVVTDVATFSDYPNHVVRKVKWETQGADGLRLAMTDLVGNAAHRASLGRAAWDYVDRYHAWSRVAAQYVDVIDRCRQTRREAAPRRGVKPTASLAAV